MNDNNPVYALAEPEAVDVAAIEQELEELWKRAASEEGTNSVTRATAFNLVYALRAPDANASELLAKLTLSHPSRSVLLLIGDEEAATAQRAWVTAYCHRPAQTSQQICSEFISLEVSGSSIPASASTVLSLLLPDLASALIWDASLPSTHPLLAALGAEMDRVICDVVGNESSAAMFNDFFSLRKHFDSDTSLTDLSWSRIFPRRVGVAALFDPQAIAADKIAEIHLKFPENKIPAETLLLAAWMANALALKNDKISLHGTKPQISFERNVTLRFEPNSKKEMLEFLLEDGTTLGVTQDERYGDCIRLTRGDNEILSRAAGNTKLDQLDRAIKLWGRDPLYERTMSRLQAWMKEMLFL